jgi:hypothetical protein
MGGTSPLCRRWADAARHIARPARGSALACVPVPFALDGYSEVRRRWARQRTEPGSDSDSGYNNFMLDNADSVNLAAR